MTKNCFHDETTTCALCIPDFCSVGKTHISEQQAAKLPHICEQPIFESGADETLAKVRATYSQRGAEYADSWHERNIVTTFLDATLVAIQVEALCDLSKLTAEEKRLILLASLIDVKDSRMGGPFKEDSIIDGIAYRALYATLRQRYEAK